MFLANTHNDTIGNSHAFCVQTKFHFCSIRHTFEYFFFPLNSFQEYSTHLKLFAWARRHCVMSSLRYTNRTSPKLIHKLRIFNEKWSKPSGNYVRAGSRSCDVLQRQARRNWKQKLYFVVGDAWSTLGHDSTKLHCLSHSLSYPVDAGAHLKAMLTEPFVYEYFKIAFWVNPNRNPASKASCLARKVALLPSLS